jgi:hypothetical protein
MRDNNIKMDHNKNIEPHYYMVCLETGPRRSSKYKYWTNFAHNRKNYEEFLHWSKNFNFFLNYSAPNNFLVISLVSYKSITLISF